MKYLHFVRDRWFEDIDVTEVALTDSKLENSNLKEMLAYYRISYFK
jgi:hypothetical protein